MEPYPKRTRSENGGFGLNSRGGEQKEWGYPQQGNGGGDLECRRFNTPEGCPYGSACRFRHVTADGRDVGQQGLSSGGKPKPCMKFFSTSGCPFGESCHFLHYVPGGLSSLGLAPVMSLSAASAAVSQRKSGGPVGDPSVTVSGYKTKLCNKFNTPEGCRFGDKCHFAHGESDLRLPNNQSRGNVRRAPVEGPRGLGPSGFSNSGTDFSNLAAYGNASNFNSQGYGEPNPPGVPANDGSATYETGSIGENVQVY
ncbi:PREDICTED: zinc finger CCCH domain-containing protein 14-like [Nelumbo nucifera]|uniref:Zinc finger CCCH domain-containing protein 14-like n=1 Tax=Nelumbo nucifera TaxID=4432 RepID=A0A1U7Z2V2_NELNU|nr:PREDICTED: zinc finger CCCH domain-containing protein 14-like [Nelumbo nucifera]